MKALADISDSYIINSKVFYLLGIMVVVPIHFYLNSMDFWMFKFKPPPPGPNHPPGPPPPRGRITPSTQVFNYFNKELTTKHPEIKYNSEDTTSSFRAHEDLIYHVLNNDNSYQAKTPAKELLQIYPIQLQGSVIINSTTTSPDQRTPFQANFVVAFSINFKVVLLGSLLFCTMWPKKLPPPERRLKLCLTALCILFSVVTLLTQIDTEKGFTGLALASLYELITKFPCSYYASLQSGNNICGILSAVLQIILLSFRLRPNENGAIQFSVGCFILIFTTIYYFVVFKNSKYFIYRIDTNHEDQRNLSTAEWMQIIPKTKWFYATIIFVEGTTHIVYPGLAALVVTPLRGTLWRDVYFVPVVTYLGYQVCCLIGRESARIVKTPKTGLILFILSAIRIVFVPLLIFCNAQPRKHLPVLFGNTTYIILLSIFAFSEGILINTTIVAIPKKLKQDEKVAAMIMVPLISTITLTMATGLNIFLTNII
ncbi:equilibrative nucleoside transporter 1-like isoform X2 [Diabrotica virgifera virgifera]|uniref:Equilibrative nucleoside transporter 1-like n=1 Tax=Diabrotica virgifera virgifera TaxID=50390 RepID=A0ABM5JUJ9_DIAVI|nr:equilibrative nucleoside transporter 1-like isoform X2 [Diabrotica virgifera virgifera]